MEHSLLIFITGLEILLLFVVVLFFIRLKRSEKTILQIQKKHATFFDKLNFNANLEKELVQSFGKRQQELARLSRELDKREVALKNLLQQAAELNRSPHFLRQMVLSGFRKGKSIQSLSRASGLSPDEVEIILSKNQHEHA